MAREEMADIARIREVISKLRNELTCYQLLDGNDILAMDKDERASFFSKYVRTVDEIERHISEWKSATHQVCDGQADATCEWRLTKKRNRITSKSPLAGDLQELHEIHLLPVYEVLKSHRSHGFQYVSKSGTGANTWHAQPYIKGVRDNGRWNAGYYLTEYEAARAVSIASAHLCHEERILELMKLIPNERFKIL